MMYKKRFVALATTVCMLFSVFSSGCGGVASASAQDVYAAAAEKTNACKSSDISLKMKMDMNMSGQSISADVTSNSKVANIDSKDLKMAMDTNISMLGQSTKVSTYYTNGYYYSLSGDLKGKYPMDLSEIVDKMNSNGFASQIKADMFKDVSSQKDGDNTIVTYTADGSKLTEFTKSAMGALSSMAGSDDISIGDVTGTATINKDGYFSDGKVKMSMTLKVSGQEASCDMDMDFVYNNPGQEVTVELPNDLDTYEEIDPESSRQQIS